METKTVEELEAELVEVRAALAAANKDAMEHRHENKELKTQVADMDAMKSTVTRQAVVSALQAEGVDAERLSKLVDMSTVVYTAEGVTGVEEAVQGLRESLPEVFEPKQRAGSADGGKKSTTDMPQELGDILAAQISR